MTEAAADPSDEIRVIVRALDQAGNRLHFLNEPVFLDLAGPARLIGPACPVLQGGSTGCWLRPTGETGTIRLDARLRDKTASVLVTLR